MDKQKKELINQNFHKVFTTFSLTYGKKVFIKEAQPDQVFDWFVKEFENYKFEELNSHMDKILKQGDDIINSLSYKDKKNNLINTLVDQILDPEKSDNTQLKKSFEDCKKEVATKHNLGKNLVTGHLAKYWEEAAELYANQ